MACDKAVEPVLRIEPLHHLPVIKDTVIHRRKVFDHIHEILPEAGNIENISQSLRRWMRKKQKRKLRTAFVSLPVLNVLSANQNVRDISRMVMAFLVPWVC